MQPGIFELIGDNDVQLVGVSGVSNSLIERRDGYGQVSSDLADDRTLSPDLPGQVGAFSLGLFLKSAST